MTLDNKTTVTFAVSVLLAVMMVGGMNAAYAQGTPEQEAEIERLLNQWLELYDQQPVYANYFEGNDDKNYLLLRIEDHTAIVDLRIDNKITSFESDIKIYKNKNFKILDREKGFLLYGSFDKLKVTIKDFKKNNKVIFPIHKLQTEYFIPKEQVWEGMQHIETLEKINDQKIQAEKEKKKLEEIENKTPFSDYILSDDKKIAIVGQIPKSLPYYKEMYFDIIVVDPAKNKYLNSIYEDAGWINDVIINSTIKDPFGKTINEFSGITEKRGKYKSEKTDFPSKFYKNLPYTININATKYFDDTETFAVTSYVSEFYTYIPEQNVGNRTRVNATQ